MSKTVPTICLGDGCSFANKITFATIDQIRKHLVQSHDYFELQKIAFKHGIIKNDNDYRGRGWLVRKVSEACIIKELESNV